MFKSTYRESVRPNPAAAGLLAMVDGVYIEHAELSDPVDPPRALWTAVLVAAVTSQKARDRFAHTDEPKHALCTLYASR